MANKSLGLITSYFPDITSVQLQQFDALISLYLEWNDKINVVSRKDIDYIVERHLLHSLSIAGIIRFKPGTSVLDVGTGGGFPGLPLAIFFPQVHFHLVDSIAKKIRVIDDIIGKLKLDNVKAQQERMENLKGRYDFIVSRAVAPMATIKFWTSSLIDRHSKNTLANGYIFLKGGDLSEEIAQSGLKCHTYEISDLFSAPFFETKKMVHATLL